MENLQKAIVMAGEVFMFVMALTVGIFMYSTLINTQETILIASENYSRRAEGASLNTDKSFIRTAKPAEVIWAVMSLLDDDDSFVADSVVVKKNSSTPLTFSRGSSGDRNIIKSTDLKSEVDITGEYNISYTYKDGKITIYYKEEL